MRKEMYGCRGNKDRIGVLVAQLGTPKAPTKQALRPYLKQFLSDPRVIEKNRALWWLILNGIILNLRPKRSAALYKRVWMEEGSPLMVYTKRQTELLKESLKQRHESIEVEFGMRYGDPSLESAVDALIAAGCSKILLFPMYPQYSATTTAATYDAVFSHILKRRLVPTLRVAEPYFADPRYISAQADIVNSFYAKCDLRPEKLVLSYHGIPEAYVERGDPYCCHCTETTEALLPALDLAKEEVIHTYQSRFGKDPWLVPYTDETIKKLAKEGVKRIAVALPGFTADCLETLDEMGNEAREEFQDFGGESLELIPCLNDSPTWISAMSEIVQDEISSWLRNAERPNMVECTVRCPVREAKKGAA